MNKIKVLIVEDNTVIAMDIKNDEPNIIIMDISLNAKKDGIEIIKDIHQTKYIPVIYLTGNEEDETINRALSTCPIGYLTKPFNRTELKSTIKLALCEKRQVKQYNSNQYKYLGFDYYFDMKNLILYYKNEILKLSENEAKFLNLLIIANGELVTFESIENEVWENKTVSTDAIRLLVSRLRTKLKWELIETIRAYGFKLNKNI